MTAFSLPTLILLTFVSYPIEAVNDSVPISIRAARDPDPALRYRLEPEFRSLRPGNAAVHYGRAVLILSTIRHRDLPAPNPANSDWKSDATIQTWTTAPLNSLPREKIKKLLAAARPALREIEEGVNRVSCEWGFTQQPLGGFLPEVQGLRPLVRLLVLQARLAIAEGRTADAVSSIRTGMTLSRHLGEYPSAIAGLVGVSASNMMLKCLEELIQAPGTPSLYWALAAVERPLVDWRRGMEAERSLLEDTFPDIARLDDGPWTLEHARQFAADLESKLFHMGSRPRFESSAWREIGLAAICAKLYPRARKSLIAQGMPEATVDAMPITQVATLYTYREYDRLRDDSFKWLNLPYWQSYNQLDRVGYQNVAAKLENPMLSLFQMLMPALKSLRVAYVRVERQFAVLQCIEAIRLHASHTGALPESLEAMTQSPAPIDPATGKPFNYTVEGARAELTAPNIPGGPHLPMFAVHQVILLVH